MFHGESEVFSEGVEKVIISEKVIIYFSANYTVNS